MRYAQFGHMHLSIFYRPVLSVSQAGIKSQGKLRTGKDIAAIKVWQEEWPGIGHQPAIKLLPRARVTWIDGQSLLLRGDVLVKRGQPLSPGFTSAFDELVSHLQALHKARHSCNQPNTAARTDT
jgi:hypothetical protein